MDLAATQIYEDEDFQCTQKISNALEAEDRIQVGTLSINSTEYQIKKGISTIGRLNSCDIVIEDVTVSKIHAEIEASTSQGSTWICDLNSSNKTKLNNLILRPNRLYELKNGSILEFGRVCATYYCTYYSTDDTLIPETPAPPRQKVAVTIPSTPDSFLNNTCMDDDESVILGTQRDEEKNIFRRPVSQCQRSVSQCQSTNIDKRISSISTRNDSQIATVSHISTTEQESKNHKVTVFDMKTQKFVEAVHVEANADTSEPSMNKHDKIAGSMAIDIHDMETQKDFFYTDKDSNNIQKSKIDQTKNQQKNLNQSNNHELESQKFGDEHIVNDIYDAETQLELNDTNAIKNIETQSNNNAGQVNQDENKNNMANVDSDETNTEKQMLRSRSNSPNSLNLSSPGVDENGPSSPLNESIHLLETTGLLEYFNEGIDKHEEIRTSNVSTPKSREEALSRKDNNIGNTLNASNKENDEDNFFDAPTQRSNHKILSSDNSKINKKNTSIIHKVPKKTPEKSQQKQNYSNDSETDAEEYLEEFNKKQNKLMNTSNKLCENNSDPSVESEDMFDLPTQRSNSIDDIQATSNPSANRSTKINEIDTNDTAPTQIIKKIQDECDQDESLPSDINDAPTQLLSHESLPETAISRNLSLNNNRSDDTSAQIINANDNISNSANNAFEDDCENADYELAPTQVLSEIENDNKKNSKCKKLNLDDTLERNLNRIFESVNDDNICEPQQMSTQNLEAILNSQCDNDLSNSTFVADVKAFTNNTPKTQSTKKSHTTDLYDNRSLRDQPAIKTSTNNANNIKADSQNSDVYFSTLTTKRKRNILKDTQDLEDSVNEISSHQNTISSMQSKMNDKKVDDNNTLTKSNRRGKRVAKNKTDAMINDGDMNKTISNKNNKINLRKSKRITAVSETGKRVLEKNSNEVEVDDTEKNLIDDFNIYVSCSSANEQVAQISDLESDDDILNHLPAVRISGTLSNPASPSTTSKDLPSQQKQTATNKKNKKHLKNKSLNKQDFENTEKNKNLNPLSNKKLSVLFDNPKLMNISSEDSDEETSFKRFRQMTERWFKNEVHFLKTKKYTRNTKKSIAFEEKKNTPNTLEDLEQNTDVKSKSLPRVSIRITHLNQQNDETHLQIPQKKVDAKSTIDNSSKSKTKSTITKRKRSLENIEQISSEKRIRTDKPIEERSISMRSQRNRTRTTGSNDKQSPNIPEHSAKIISRENSPMIKNTKLSADDKTSFNTLEQTQNTLYPKMHENVISTRSKGAKHKSSSVIVKENSNYKTKQVPMNVEKVSQVQDKFLKIILKPIGMESQEVEMIMEKASSNNTQNENLSIKERSNVNIFQRPSRFKNRKQLNIEENSVSTSMSAKDDSDNAQSDNLVPKKGRGRFTKKDSSALLEANVPKKKEVFKKPSPSFLNSSVRNSSTDENNQDNTENSVSLNSKSSKSKTANIKKKKKLEMQDSAINDNIKTNTSVENTSLVLTPSRTRRSTSILNNSTLSATHKILFTGITKDYSKMIKALGGNKVEDLAKCTILITDKVRRTYKFLCALAKGIPIVSINWLEDSNSIAEFLDWDKYILKDPIAEAKFGFKLRKSLIKAKEKRLLDGYTVVLTSGVAPPPISELKDMVTSCGGKVLVRPPIKWPEHAVIISREEDLMNAQKFLAKAPKTVTVQSTEFILTGILRQETDFDKYKLM